MITYGAIADGIDMDDFITCFAPKPFLLEGPSRTFCIEGAVKAYERGRRIYEIFGQEDNIRLFVSKGTHSFTDELRQAAVNWFKNVKGR